MRRDQEPNVPVAVVGGGPAGFAAALALAVSGVPTALIARRGAVTDNRTTALLDASVQMLKDLDVWRRCENEATPLRVMRLVDDTDRLIRAPEVRFAAAEIGLDAFGYNLGNRELVAAMEDRAAELPNLERVDDEASHFAMGPSDVGITTGSGRSLRAQLVVGADGRRSASRAAAGITVHHRALPQAAVTFNVAHTRPHHDMSTEFHTAEGPCALVPARGDRSNVVWVTTPDRARRLMALNDDDLGIAIETQAHSILGKMRLEAGRFLFPLSFDRATRIANRRVALVGEAAHVVPPLGAQGLNLGLRDSAAIAKIASESISRGDDPGDDKSLARYRNARRSDIAARSLAVDIATRTLLSDLLPLQAVRALGMHLIAGVPPLRHLLLHEGIAPWSGLPRILRNPQTI